MRKSDEQSQPSRSLPKIFLSMPKDQNYKKIITEAFNRFDGEEYGGTVEEMGIEVLQSLKQKYLVVDKNGKPIDDEAARQSMSILAKISSRSLSFISPSYVLSTSSFN